MLNELKNAVLEANLELPKMKLVTYTWGNVSALDKEKKLVAIKPSGVSYSDMTEKDIVITDLNGKVVEGNYKPSSDLMTHLEIYKNFENVNSVVHTHSRWATIWAQAGKSIPAFGTTHADYFYGSVPCTRKMTKEEIEKDYEKNTGKVIVEEFKDKNPLYILGVLVNNHGPFAWGKDSKESVHNAVVLEEIAMMAYHTVSLNNSITSIDDSLLDKHFLRKHGPKAYYGQGNVKT